MRARFRSWPLGVAVLALLGLIGCATSPDGKRAYQTYAELGEKFGLLRRDFAPADAPYDRRSLVKNFELVVFEPEAQLVEINPALAEKEFIVSKWLENIDYRLVGDDVRASDRQTMDTLTSKLSWYTGLDIVEARPSIEPNITILILSPGARELLLDYLDRTGVDYADSIVESWVRTLEVPCAGFLNSAPETRGEIVRATVLIKAELEGVLRESCLHEEFVQSLGLTNDHPDVRPSLFNDDEEFALLTQHDGDLLRILYDARIEPGMSRAEAMPLVREIVKDVRPADE